MKKWNVRPFSPTLCLTTIATANIFSFILPHLVLLSQITLCSLFDAMTHDGSLPLLAHTTQWIKVESGKMTESKTRIASGKDAGNYGPRYVSQHSC